MNHDFIDRLDELRERVGFALPVTSGYRHPSHPAEAHKPNGGGMHTLGIAADLACRGERMYIVVAEAILMGFTGIGVGKGFVHLDDRAGPPLMWGY